MGEGLHVSRVRVYMWVLDVYYIKCFSYTFYHYYVVHAPLLRLILKYWMIFSFNHLFFGGGVINSSTMIQMQHHKITRTNIGNISPRIRWLCTSSTWHTNLKDTLKHDRSTWTPYGNGSTCRQIRKAIEGKVNNLSTSKPVWWTVQAPSLGSLCFQAILFLYSYVHCS